MLTLIRSIFIAVLFTGLAHAEFKLDKDISILSEQSYGVMEEGFKVNEELFEFLAARPCELGAKSDCDRPMTVADIEKLKELLRNLDSWRNKAFEVVFPATNVLKGMGFKLVKGSAHKVEQKTRLNSSLRLEKYLKVTFAPQDSASMEFAQKMKISVAQAMLLYDSFYRLADTLAKAKKIRSILQYDMPEDGQILHRTYALAMDSQWWQENKTSLSFVEQVKALGESESARLLGSRFSHYIEKSFIADRMSKNDQFFRLVSVMQFNRQMSQTRFFGSLDSLIGRLSQFFGNTVGRVQTRDGKLKALAENGQVMKAMKQQLRPLDILLEKTPFRLTDKFIPGHYGHVAIWLGNPAELADMTIKHHGQTIALLDHPVVLPYLEAMSQGKLIVEALRIPGVTMNTLEHFMDIDDLLVLRAPEQVLLSPAEMIVKTLQQVGKGYDFNFDIETQREIVCSELIYTVFTTEDWPIDRSMGRYTISPDHVAWKAVDECYETLILYTDGKEIKTGKREALSKILTDARGINYTSTGARCD